MIITLQGIIRYGLFFSLIVPLLLWSGFSDPFATSKTVPFGLAVDLAAAACLALLWLEKREARDGGSAAPQRNPVFAALLVFCLYSGISALFSVDFHRSVWGVAARQDGLFLWAHMLAWAALLVWYSRRFAVPAGDRTGTARPKATAPEGASGLHLFLRFSFWVSAVAALAALYEWAEQYFDIHWLIPDLLRKSTLGRAGGPIGSPTFLAPYLSFHLFYGIHYLCALRGPGDPAAGSPAGARRRKTGRRTKTAAAVVAAQAVMIAAILVGQTRAALLGLLAGLLMVAIWTVIRPVWGRIGRLAAFGFLLALPLLAGWMWHLRNSPTPVQNPLLRRLAEMSISRTASVFERLLFWKGAIRSFEDHPLIGWGHNNVYYGLSRHYDPELVRTNPMGIDSIFTVYDKAHNYYLDLLAEKGLIGAVLWLVIAAAVFGRLFSLRDRVLSMTAAAGLLAYATASIFAFDSFATLFGLFLFLTPLMENGPDSRAVSGTKPEKRGGGHRPAISPRAALARKALLSTGILASLGSLYVCSQIGFASAAYWKARGLAAASPSLGMSAYRQALDYASPYRDREKIECALAVTGSLLAGRPSPDPRGLSAESMALADEAVRAFPRDLAIYALLADRCNNLGIRVDRAYLDWAARYGEAALQLSPNRQEIAFFLARTRILKGETRRAVELTQQIVAAYPDFPLAHWYHGLSLLADNQREEAGDSLVRAWRLGYRFRSADEERVVRESLGEEGYLKLKRME